MDETHGTALIRKAECKPQATNNCTLIGVMLSLFLGVICTLPAFGGTTAAPATKKTSAVGLDFSKIWTGDFDGMLQQRQLRALVAYSKTDYYVVHGVQHGSSYEYLKAFEQEVNRKYPPKQKNLRFHVVFVPFPGTNCCRGW